MIYMFISLARTSLALSAYLAVLQCYGAAPLIDLIADRVVTFLAWEQMPRSRDHILVVSPGSCMSHDVREDLLNIQLMDYSLSNIRLLLLREQR